jgi:site-specific recombinase XerD
MEQSNSPVSPPLPLDQLVTSALHQLEQLGYSRRSLNRYRTVWRHLTEFARQHTLGETFSETLAARFVDAYRIRAGELTQPKEQWRHHIGVGLKMLGDWAHQGRIARPVADLHKVHLFPAMQKALRAYEQYGKERLYLQPSTLRRRLTALTVFLEFLRSRHIKTLDQMQAVDVSEFVVSRDHLQPRTVARIIADVRSFLRFLMLRGIVQTDLSGALPKVRVPRDAHIPSVWAPDLLVKLLGVIDRSSAKGKRDYAIILLACRLGLRVGDIRALKLDDLHWADATLKLTQSKTNTPLLLPLTEEVGAALIDYLRSGRPTTPYREVFLTLTSPVAPFSPTNLYHIVAYWRHLAGITFPTAQRRGLHALRHTLATQLLQAQTPLHTIGDILGHASVESTRLYAKADVEALRSVALELEEVSDAEG